MGAILALTLSVNGTTITGYPSQASGNYHFILGQKDKNIEFFKKIAFRVAIEDINADPTILTNTQINYLIWDTQGTESVSIEIIFKTFF